MWEIPKVPPGRIVLIRARSFYCKLIKLKHVTNPPLGFEPSTFESKGIETSDYDAQTNSTTTARQY